MSEAPENGRVPDSESGARTEVECSECGGPVPYAGRGRPPKYCGRCSPNANRVRDAKRALINGDLDRARDLINAGPGRQSSGGAAAEALRPKAFAVALSITDDDVRSAAAIAGIDDMTDEDLEALAAEVKEKHRRLYQGELSAELDLGHQAIRLLFTNAVASASALPAAQAAQSIQRLTDAMSKLSTSSAKPVYSDLTVNVVFDGKDQP